MKIAKIVAASFVTCVLSLGFAAYASAADSSVQSVDNNSVTNVVTSHKSEVKTVISNDSNVSGGTTSSSDTTSNSVSEIIPGASNSGGSESTVSTQTQSKSSVSVNSDSNSNSPTAGKNDDGNTGSAAVDKDGLINQQNAAAVSLADQNNTPISAVVTPQVKAQLQAKMQDDYGSQSKLMGSGGSVNSHAVVHEPVVPNPSTPVTPAPAKNLPIEGAIAGISGLLSTITLPVRNSTPVLPVSARLTASLILVLIACLTVVVTLFVGRRFVDELKASGYNHAARADAASSNFSFATPSKVSFSGVFEPRQQLAFFGVRNKVLGF